MPKGPSAASDEDVSLFGLSVFSLDTQAWTLKERLFAARARWTKDAYILERGWRRTYESPPVFQHLEDVATREVEPPTYFRRQDPQLEGLRFAQLQSHIGSLEKLGVDVARLKVQLHLKVASPLVALVMTLIGIRFSFTVGRRGTLFGIGISVVIAIVYWACLKLFEAMGNNAVLPASVAAWAPNLIFGAVAVYLMLTVET
jgi:lipopolysaccharide export LptBFGC system permease protein LptF